MDRDGEQMFEWLKKNNGIDVNMSGQGVAARDHYGSNIALGGNTCVYDM